MNIYKWFWTHTIKRPYTWLIRDSWVDVEIVWILGLLIIGSIVGINWNLADKISVRDIAIGYLLGHIFFGTKQIYHQGLKEKKK